MSSYPECEKATRHPRAGTSGKRGQEPVTQEEVNAGLATSRRETQKD